jgi:hypothetical protein
LQRPVGGLIVDEEHHRSLGEARDRHEIGAGEFGLPAEHLVDLGEAGNRDDMHEKGVTIGRRAGGELGADLAGRTGLGLNHDGLLQDRLKHGGEGSCHDVGGAPWREGIDDGDGPAWVILLCADGKPRQRRRRGRRPGNEPAPVHGFSLRL